jgi:hypothetical protein
MQLTNTDKWIYLDKTPGEQTRAYVRLGNGVTGVTPANNPIVDSKHYINAKNPTTKVLGMSKQFNIAMERYKGDDANDFIAGLAEKIGSALLTTLIVVDHHDVAEVTAKPAKLYGVTIAVNNEGAIVGGGAMDMDVSVYANGDPLSGTFNETTSVWTVAT